MGRLATNPVSGLTTWQLVDTTTWRASDSFTVIKDGKLIPARITKAPFLRRIVASGDDASVELESALGTMRIKGVTALSTFRIGNPDIGGLNLQRGGVLYTKDDQRAYGMMERSSHESLTTIG